MKKRNSRSRRKIFLLFLALPFLFFSSLYIYAKYIEPFALNTVPLTINSDLIKEDADGLRIVVFADTHFGKYYSTEDFESVILAINEEEPDFVFFLGDLMDHYQEYSETENVEEISDLLLQINAPLGKYAVFGNHDYGGGAERSYPDIMEAGGFSVLLNQVNLFENLGIQLIGIDDVLIGYGTPETAQKAEIGLFDIVLAHEPDIADEILSANFDLMLSGHTHGRQINVGFFDDYILPPYGQTYIQGLYELSSAQDATLYVNAG
ncbi:MAG: metallophosphoesterase, partial [Eubacteriales bacterium]|nr:metallophosphoesterase [Eubacteriales bacterium]